VISAAASVRRTDGVAVPRRIKVLIVDDSVVARAVLGRMVAADPGLEIVGEASGAADALVILRRTRVDVILLDVEMPGTSGLQALPEILKEGRGARVLVVSSLAEEGAAATVEALRLGAADTLPKPGAGRISGQFSLQLLSKVRALGEARPSHNLIPARPAVPMQVRRPGTEPIACLAIGASTGGLHALATLFANLPARIGVPILVTQHLPTVFMPFFARQLALVSKREVIVAHSGAPLRPDLVMVAPGNAHLQIAGGRGGPVVALSERPAPAGCLPSVDPMLAAVADTFGSAALGVVLTGMGRDGVEGARALVGAGGSVFVQDAESSTVWGMPRAVAEAGLAAGVLDPAGIAHRIAIFAPKLAPAG